MMVAAFLRGAFKAFGAIGAAAALCTSAQAQNPTSSADFRINHAADAKVRGTTAPDNADALMRTAIRSTGERAAFRRLVPVLGPCLPKGLKMELDVAWLRGVVAEGLLRSMREWGARA